MSEVWHYLKCLGIVIVAIPVLLGLLALIFTQFIPCLIIACILWFSYFVYCQDKATRDKKRRGF